MRAPAPDPVAAAALLTYRRAAAVATAAAELQEAARAWLLAAAAAADPPPIAGSSAAAASPHVAVATRADLAPAAVRDVKQVRRRTPRVLDVERANAELQTLRRKPF